MNGEGAAAQPALTQHDLLIGGWPGTDSGTPAEIRSRRPP